MWHLFTHGLVLQYFHPSTILKAQIFHFHATFLESWNCFPLVLKLCQYSPSSKTYSTCNPLHDWPQLVTPFILARGLFLVILICTLPPNRWTTLCFVATLTSIRGMGDSLHKWTILKRNTRFSKTVGFLRLSQCFCRCFLACLDWVSKNFCSYTLLRENWWWWRKINKEQWTHFSWMGTVPVPDVTVISLQYILYPQLSMVS